MPKFSATYREKPTAQPERSERLAVSLFDLDQLDPELRRRLTNGKLSLPPVYPFGKDEPQSAAMAFSCPLLEAALVCDVLRNYCRRVGFTTVRVWITPLVIGNSLIGPWKLLRDDTILTLDGDHLNPEVFRPVVKLESVAPPIKRLV